MINLWKVVKHTHSGAKVSIRTKITMPYIFLAILIAIGASIIVSNLIFDTVEERYNNQLAEVALLSSELMVKEEQDLLDGLRLIANANGLAAAIQTGDVDAIREVTFGIVVNQRIGAVQFLDANAQPILSMQHNADGFVEDYRFSQGGEAGFFADLPFVQNVLNGFQDELGNKFSGLVTTHKESWFYISGPVLNENQERIGILLVGTSLEDLVGNLRNKTFGQITLYQLDGTPIISSLPYPPQPLDGTLAESVIIHQDEPHSPLHEITYERTIDVVEHQYSEVLAPWEVRGDVDIGIFGAALQRNFLIKPSPLTRLQFIFFIAVIIAMILIIGRSLANLITRPLLGLVKVSEAIAKGNYNTTIDVKTNDEIDILATSFHEMALNLQRSQVEILEAYDSALNGWTKALELRDKDTEGHTKRVADMTVTLATQAGIAAENIVHIRRGALLHDIGKMAIPDRILHKPGPLDAEEWAIMKRHPLYAYEMIKDINFLEKSSNIPRYHHENWDGSGYPYGLKGKEIPLEARIFAIVDSWDAMLSERPYKKSFSPQASLRSIREESGRKYDPELVKLFEAFIIPYDNLDG